MGKNAKGMLLIFFILSIFSTILAGAKGGWVVALSVLFALVALFFLATAIVAAINRNDCDDTD